MGHWNWPLIFEAVGAAGVVVGLLAGAVKLILTRIDRTAKQNEEMLEKQRRFELDWNGEDARPGHLRVPPMIERIANIESNTTTAAGQIEDLRGRVGKLEEERILDRQELQSHIRTGHLI